MLQGHKQKLTWNFYLIFNSKNMKSERCRKVAVCKNPSSIYRSSADSTVWKRHFEALVQNTFTRHRVYYPVPGSNRRDDMHTINFQLKRKRKKYHIWMPTRQQHHQHPIYEHCAGLLLTLSFCWFKTAPELQHPAVKTYWNDSFYRQVNEANYIQLKRSK